MQRFFVSLTLAVLILSGLFCPGYADQSKNNLPQAKNIERIIGQVVEIVEIATNHDSVNSLLNQAEELAQPENDLHQSIHILILRGLNEYYSNNYEGAVDFYYRALEMAERSNDSTYLARANHNLGMIYDELEDYDEAINYYTKSLAISQSINDNKLSAKTFQNIAICYQNKHDIPKALEYNERAKKLAIAQKDTSMIIDLINNLGTIAYDQKKLDESLAQYEQALELYKKRKDRHGVAFAYNNIGLVFLDKKDYVRSLDYFKRSLFLADELKMLDFKADIYSNLTIYYKEVGDYEKAYNYYDKFNTVYDSLAGEKKDKMIRQIQAKYQLGKKNRELEELKHKSQTQLHAIDTARSTQIYLGAIAILVVVLMIATIYLLWKEKKLAIELKAKTEELHQLNLSKDKFFSIIAHDLKNPFNVLVSYTSLLKTDMDMFTKDELRQIFADLNQASENGFNLLQNLLVWTRSQTNRIHIFKTTFKLGEVFENVKALVELNLIAKEQNLSVEIDPEITVYADKEMIATVIRNLVFNAVKFSPKGSEIKLVAKKIDEEIQVEVIDSGVGIPKQIIQNLFRIDKSTSMQGTEGETGTGLGLVICHEFVVKNNGRIWVESEEGRGTVFSFTIPLRESGNMA